MSRNGKIKTFCLLIVLCILNCTRNPIFENDISESEQLVIKGRVKLSDESVPDQVIVWLEGLNLTTSTDLSGEYSLQLFPPEIQPGGGLNGDYKLYFFLGNYKIVYFNVKIANGYFVFNDGVVDSDGIVKTVTLQKLLDIETSVEPLLMKSYASVEMTISVRMIPRVNSVSVESYKTADNNFYSGIIKKVDAPTEEALLTFGNGDKKIEPIESEKVWKMSYLLNTDNFEIGAYEFYPYIKVVQNIPHDLLRKIGVNFDDFHIDFLKIPYKRKNGFFEISTRIIEGRIRLNDNIKPDNIFVWLEGLNISRTTDYYGDFMLTLPEPEMQLGGGVNGDFRLYYYLGNYKLEHSLLKIENGIFIYGDADLTHEGRVVAHDAIESNIITLKKLLDVTTEITPGHISYTQNDSLKMNVTLTPLESPLNITTVRDSSGNFTGAYFRNIDDPIEFSILSSGTAVQVTEYITNTQVFEMDNRVIPVLAPGEYKVIPYIYVIQNDVPQALLENFGLTATEFNRQYLNIPFKRQNGYLVVTN